MKTREEITRILKESIPHLQKEFKVKDIGIFGSFIHDEASEKSDVDLLVEFSGTIGWEFIDLKDFLEDAIGLKVDLVTKKALKPQLRKAILKEVVYV
ncbi:MAG: nucleotidyltransferase family protein [Candidatus Omnitrophica bacterium]|nr:nucleotidyltransferase family protein [Candidatus Omnitrophota bacterium]